MRYQNHQNYSRNTLMYLISGKPNLSLDESQYLRVVFYADSDAIFYCH